MSLESEITRISNAKADIKTAIEQKGVDISDEARIDDYADYVNQIGADEEEFTVRFYDFDGTIVAQYTRSTFINLSAMPANPTHAGLTSQGWNWSLADAKAYVEEFGGLEIGQMYCTTDGKTKLYITISDTGRTTLPFYWTQTVASGVSINWGDGSAAQSFSGTGNHNTTHQYSAIGDYVITLTVSSGTFSLGNGASGSTVFKGGSTYRVYQSMLKKVEFGTGITSIGAYAFHNCVNLTTVTIPSGLTGFSATGSFYNCCNLLQLTVPSGAVTIGSSYCYCCYGIIAICIPKSVKTIGDNAFQICYRLNSISIPSGVTSCGRGLFYSCHSLDTIRISNTVTANTNYFYIGNPRYLINWDVPDGVTSLTYNTFMGCYALKSVTLPNTLKVIGTNAFYYCMSLPHIDIPNSVTGISSQAFMYCYSLQELTIPSGVTAITNYMCYCPYALQKVVFPSGLKTIGTYAFYNAYSLSTVTIPSGVTSIGTYAFRYCYGVKTYYVYPTTPPTLGTNVFEGIQSDAIIYVPSASVDTYKAATGWKTYAANIQAMP